MKKHSTYKAIRRPSGSYEYRNVFLDKRRGNWTFARYTYIDGHYNISSFYDGARTLKDAQDLVDCLLADGHEAKAGGLWSPAAIAYEIALNANK